MRTDTAPVVRLSEYTAPVFLIPHVRLDVQIEDETVCVTGELDLVRQRAGELILDHEFCDVEGVALDGAALPEDQWSLQGGKLTVNGVGERAKLTLKTRFDPARNTALSGIYLSKGRLCSQCEAEGFRRILPFLDRPDVLSTYQVTITADKDRFPYLLSNGNLVSQEELGGGRQRVVWEDPFPKPAYLFALVAGDFDTVTDRFTTMSGRDISLVIHVDKGDADRALYAMDALKRSMRWDEVTFGREYDLDLFMIVAVRDFNFGAMENKGLNIFNSSLLLADADTATDADYEAIESVVAHEYFHNWTGNRITCRDWFQLCLKEGFTVYRDQEFTADQRGAAPSRIKDVAALRARQFREDAGPLSHPVRPDHYEKIDNFYTATVYEKGAELIRVLHRIIGADAFREGTDRYFERFDGTAATVEDLIGSFEQPDFDPAQFLVWYAQRGTPQVRVTPHHDAASGRLVLDIEQNAPATQPDWKPVPIPLVTGLLDAEGRSLPFRIEGTGDTLDEATLILREARQRFTLTGLDGIDEIVISTLRGFSAPVLLHLDEPAGHRMVRASADPDPFNRYEALRDLVIAEVIALSEGRMDEPGAQMTEAFARLVEEAPRDPAFVSLALMVPGINDLAQHVEVFDPAGLSAARDQFMQGLASALADPLRTLHDQVSQRLDGPFSPTPEAAVWRALRNACLAILAYHGPSGAPLAEARDAQADNMTDQIAALAALDVADQAAFDAALDRFRGRFGAQPLVMDKWFALQARSRGDGTLSRLQRLLSDGEFDTANPNRARAVLGSFALFNPVLFHTPEGYDTFIEQVMEIDPRNPALAARLMGAFETWPSLISPQRDMARARLQAVAGRDQLSANVSEIVSRMLAVSS